MNAFDRARRATGMAACAAFMLLLVAAPAYAVHGYMMPVPPDAIGLGHQLALDGRTALVASYHRAYIMTRSDFGWNGADVTTLSLEIPAGWYVEDVALSGNTGVVAAGGLCYGCGLRVYVFDRNQGGLDAWGPVTVLYHDEPGNIGRGRLALSGETLVVGVRAAMASSGSVRGAAYVYQRDLGGLNAWGLVRELRRPADQPGVQIFFAEDVAINGEGTIVVGGTQAVLAAPCAPCSLAFAQVFDRDHGGANTWGRSGSLPVTLPDGTSIPSVAVDGDTAAVARAATAGAPLPNVPTLVQLFQRQPGTQTWTLTKALAPVPGGQVDQTAISLKNNRLAVASSSQSGPAAWVYARNNGSPNGWALESAFAGGGVGFAASSVSVSGYSVLVGNPSYPVGGTTGQTGEFVTDFDADNITDEIDPCPGDPLNNPDCRRNVAAHPVVDANLSLLGTSVGLANSDYRITARFKNTSSTLIRSPFFSVGELTGENVLKNGDGGASGVGATVSVDIGDGLLFPGESMEVTFVIGLASRQPFRFFVHAHGDTH